MPWMWLHSLLRSVGSSGFYIFQLFSNDSPSSALVVQSMHTLNYIFCSTNMSHCQITYHYGNPNKLFSNFMKLTTLLPNVWKPGTPSLKPMLWMICCESYMTQIWRVCVCLLKLSLLYPAPHMDTAMLRISPSFLTKPSEQLAKNNMTCCLRSGLRPPGEDITGGRSWYGLKPVPLWPP